MRQKDHNYLRMTDTTLKMVNSNNFVWAMSKPFARQVTIVQTAYRNTGVQQQGGDVVTTGITDDKDLAADAAIKQAVLLSSFTMAYAAENDNHALYDQMNVSFRGLDRLPDEALAPRLTDLLTWMRAIGTPLEEYGVTTDGLIDLENKIKKFTDLNPTPRTAIATRKTSNENIPGLLRTIRKAFAIMDDLVKQWKDTNPDFVSTYFNARIVIDLGRRSEEKEEVKG